MRAKNKIKLYIITIAVLSLIFSNGTIAQENNNSSATVVDNPENITVEIQKEALTGNENATEADVKKPIENNGNIESPFPQEISPNKDENNSENKDALINDEKAIEADIKEIKPDENTEAIEKTIEGDIEELEPNDTKETIEKPLSARAVVVDIISDQLEYFQDSDSFVATGKAKVLITEENAELIADKIVYFQGKQYITAEGNVKITKDGRTILGTYAKVNLDSQSAMITNPQSVISKVRMQAKEANLYPEYIELTDGDAVVNQEDLDVNLSAGEYRPRELHSDIPGRGPVDVENKENKKPSYRIVAKEIELDRAKTVNNLIVKNASIYIGKVKIGRLPRLTLTVGEQAKAVEAMMPEVGFDKTIGGIYFGPSLTLDLPKNSVLRLSPVFSAAGREHVVGGGGIVRFRSGINKTDFAYTTTGNRIVLDGEQKLYKDTTKIKYTINEYPDDGFLGTGFYRPLYLAELVDERKLGKVLNHNFYSRGSAGIARDVNDGIATARLQLQGSVISDKPILHYKDNVEFRLESQFNLAYYGTGNKYAVVRGGPRVDWKVWRLDLTTTYLQAGVWGSTPFVFDEFIRGTSNLIVAGDFKLCKFLSVGNLRSLNLRKDGVDPSFTTENQFYARVGPEDFKFRVGYDLERKRSTFGIDLLLGSGRSALKFDKMKILNPGTDLNY